MALRQADKIVETTSAFKMLSDPTRFRILCLLIKYRDGACVSYISETLDISHSATSHQLSKLEARGVVTCYREGQKICYHLKNTPFVENLIKVIHIFQPH